MKNTKYKYKFCAHETILASKITFGAYFDCCLDVHHEFDFNDFEYFIYNYNSETGDLLTVYGYLPKIKQCMLLFHKFGYGVKRNFLFFGTYSNVNNIINSLYSNVKNEICSKEKFANDFLETVNFINENKISYGQMKRLFLVSSNFGRILPNDVAYNILMHKFGIIKPDSYDCVVVDLHQLKKYVYIYNDEQEIIHIPTHLHELKRNFNVKK